jgi:glyoxylase-like metal-dependent hydrolase (beta-lactamase superfamily II)
MPDGVTEVARGVYRVEDTAAVYLVLGDRDDEGLADAVTVDFGTGLVLDHLERLGVRRVTDVLMTHHHRDQGQGLPRAIRHGARVHVPPVEVDLFTRPDELWAERNLDDDYDLRQDRFSLLEPVAVAGTLPEYREARFGTVTLRTIPTPGHTVGSVTLLLDRDGRRLAFTGDLVHAPGRVWSLSATQWSYTGVEGPAMLVLSCMLLRDERPDLLLPSHGAPIADADAALRLLGERMQAYVDSRRADPWDLEARLRAPYVPVSPHLLANVTSLSCSYVLLSDTGEALVVDYGYDMTTGVVPGTGRATKRPWLASLPALHAQFGVTRVAVTLPTHHHDDHVAGMPLLREVEGTEIWAPSTVAPVLTDPSREDLPCQWYDPVPVDRVLPVGSSFTWNEYTITVHDQPGHTLYHVAYEVEVDGVTVLFTGDQQENLGVTGTRTEVLNYQYRNRFRLGDYPRSAAMYRQVAPGLLLSGHWAPRPVDDAYLDLLTATADAVDQLHRDLLPDPTTDVDLGPEGTCARIEPYRSRIATGQDLAIEVVVRNPLPDRAPVSVCPVVPPGWTVSEQERRVVVDPGAECRMSFRLSPPAVPVRKARIAVDVRVGDVRLGQHADAVVTVVAAAV